MIHPFADTETERIWSGRRSRKLPADIQQRAISKLALINRAKSLDDLRISGESRFHQRRP